MNYHLQYIDQRLFIYGDVNNKLKTTNYLCEEIYKIVFTLCLRRYKFTIYKIIPSES